MNKIEDSWTKSSLKRMSNDAMYSTIFSNVKFILATCVTRILVTILVGVQLVKFIPIDSTVLCNIVSYVIGYIVAGFMNKFFFVPILYRILNHFTEDKYYFLDEEGKKNADKMNKEIKTFVKW